MKKTLALLSLCWLSLSAACGPKPEDPTDPTTPSGPITVTGQVFESPGVPEPSALVLIPGNDRKAQVVDSQGRFSIPDITPPYNLIIRQTIGSRALARVYVGLTLQEPSIVMSSGSPDHFRTTTTFKGKITGVQSSSGTPTVYATYAAPVPVDAWYGVSAGGGGSMDKDGNFSASFISYVHRQPTAGGSLVAYQYEEVEGQPRKYLAYGQRDNVTYQASPPPQEIVMTPVKSSQLAVEISLPTDVYRASAGLGMELSPSVSVGLSGLKMDSTKNSVGVPEIPQATFQISGTMDNGGEASWLRSGIKAGESVQITVPKPAQLIVPSSGETGVSLTATLSWSQVPRSVYVSYFDCGAYVAEIVQTGNQLVLPDLSGVNMTLTAGEKCTSYLNAYAPFSSVDELTGNFYQKHLERARTEPVFYTFYAGDFTLAK